MDLRHNEQKQDNEEVFNKLHSLWTDSDHSWNWLKMKRPIRGCLSSFSPLSFLFPSPSPPPPPFLLSPFFSLSVSVSSPYPRLDRLFTSYKLRNVFPIYFHPCFGAVSLKQSVLEFSSKGTKPPYPWAFVCLTLIRIMAWSVHSINRPETWTEGETPNRSTPSPRGGAQTWKYRVVSKYMQTD